MTMSEISNELDLYKPDLKTAKNGPHVYIKMDKDTPIW